MVHDPLPPPDYTLIQAIGSVIGAFLSLTYVRPMNLIDLFARGSFSVLSGFVFGFVLLEYMSWPETARHWMAASAAVAGFSWLLAGAGVRILQSVNKWPFSK
jgi:hypothetical protein